MTNQRPLKVLSGQSITITPHAHFSVPDKSDQATFRLKLSASKTGKGLLEKKSSLSRWFGKVSDQYSDEKSVDLSKRYNPREAPLDENLLRLNSQRGVIDLIYTNQTGDDVYLEWCGSSPSKILEEKQEDGSWDSLVRRDTYHLGKKIGRGRGCDMPLLKPNKVAKDSTTTISAFISFDSSAEVHGYYRAKLKVFKNIKFEDDRDSYYHYVDPIEDQYTEEVEYTLDLESVRKRVLLEREDAKKRKARQDSLRQLYRRDQSNRP